MTRAALHPESLLRVPLVARAFTDPRIRPTPRAVDNRWHYEGLVPQRITGFNPFDGRFFYAAESRLASFLAAPEGSARNHNEGDHLVYEVLLGVHDYLHAWAYGFIRARAPSLRLGQGEITAERVEELLFAHLLTEAAATVGWDYWTLSTTDLNEHCPIGTAHRNFAVEYRESLLPEYRRARPSLEVQRPAFFAEIAALYSSGALPGFTLEHLRRSPLLDHWLRHEIEYVLKQRRYFREWLAHLSGLPIDPARADRPVACAAAPWQRALVADLGEALFALVKHGRDDAELDLAPIGSTWRAPACAIDWRFTNLAAGEDAPVEHAPSNDWLAIQMISAVDYARADREKIPSIRALRARRDVAGLRALLDGEPRVGAVGAEPRDLLVLA
jgi:hypothetical protein